MSLKPLRWRPAAERDAATLATHYAAEGGARLELQFIAALAAAFELIREHPGCGSTRHAALFPELPVPLRFHPLRRFDRIVVYYMDQPTHVEVIRIWHTARGLDVIMQS